MIDGKTGFLVDVNDNTQMVKALIRLMTNPDLASQMGHAARNHALATFSPEALANRLTQIWTTYLAEKGISVDS